jgi:hypothetical protein
MNADWHLTTPVAFLIFNRPDTTARVFEEIRRARPPRLLVVADGPRLNRPGEAENVPTIRRVSWYPSRGVRLAQHPHQGVADILNGTSALSR